MYGRLVPDGKGRRIEEVLSVDARTTPPVAPRRSIFWEAISGGPSSGTSVEETGTMKWLNVDKGFGFIALGWWWQGCIRPHLGSRTIRAHGPQ